MWSINLSVYTTRACDSYRGYIGFQVA